MERAGHVGAVKWGQLGWLLRTSPTHRRHARLPATRLNLALQRCRWHAAARLLPVMSQQTGALGTRLAQPPLAYRQALASISVPRSFSARRNGSSAHRCSTRMPAFMHHALRGTCAREHAAAGDSAQWRRQGERRRPRRTTSSPLAPTCCRRWLMTLGYECAGRSWRLRCS